MMYAVVLYYSLPPIHNFFSLLHFFAATGHPQNTAGLQHEIPF